MIQATAAERSFALRLGWKQLALRFLILLCDCRDGQGLDAEKQAGFLDVLSGSRPAPSSPGELLFSSGDSAVLDPKKVAEINKLVPKSGIYQSLREGHIEAVRKCIDLLRETDDPGAILRRAFSLRDQINRHVWIYGVIGTTIYSPAMNDLAKPALVELIPDRLISYGVIEQAGRRSRQRRQAQGQCIKLDGRNGEANGIENSLWYFREDIMVNAQHWYWHLVYPFGFRIRPDRRGELFFYFHQSMLARYNAERLSSNLPPVIPLQVDASRDRIIEEGYYPYLTDINSSRQPRHPIDYNTVISGRTSIVQDLQTLYAAIDSGTVVQQNGQAVYLNNTIGIDILGDLVESVSNVENRARYGNVHNNGHVRIACLGNASQSCNNDFGVMADTTTSMRDIAFYRWHIFVNNIFERHKASLPEYPLNSVGNDVALLVWAGVQVAGIEVSSGSSIPKNNLYTFWQYKTFDISRGLDLRGGSTLSPVPVCLKHLNHQDFEFKITVNKQGSSSEKASLRIFLGPRFNIGGRRFTMEEQRKLFFVIDTFTVYLTKGNNVIRRNSTATSLTKPWSKTFAELEKEIDQNSPSMPQCGCGWPHHLLLPRGNKAGMIYDLFVLVTNGIEDSSGDLGTQPPGSTCSQPYHYCGIRGQSYPDRKPMGYPFDRHPPTLTNVSPNRRPENLDEYVAAIPNSGTVQVTITHTDEIRET